VTEEEGWPAGPSYVCFDATALIHCAATGYLDELGSWFLSGAFTAQHIMDVEIRRAAARYPKNMAVCAAPWLTAVAVDDPEDLANFAWLGRALDTQAPARISLASGRIISMGSRSPAPRAERLTQHSCLHPVGERAQLQPTRPLP
jgi:hypothetical protein